MIETREANVTLIRLLYKKRIDVPLLVNLFRDDECFQKKILLTNLDYYNDSEITLLFACCKKANYTIRCISLLNSAEPYDFIKFFDFYESNTIVYDESHIMSLKKLYETQNDEEATPETIIGYMCMLVCKNYIFIGNCDRIMVGRKPLVTHIKELIYKPYKFFMKSYRDISFSGNLEPKSYIEMLPYVNFLTKSKYTDEFCRRFSVIGKKNSMVLSMSKIEDMYIDEAKRTWECVDVTLKTGRFVHKKVDTHGKISFNKQDNKTLNHFLRVDDHYNYIDLRKSIIQLYCTLNIKAPVNTYFHQEV